MELIKKKKKEEDKICVQVDTSKQSLAEGKKKNLFLRLLNTYTTHTFGRINIGLLGGGMLRWG